ncbi:MAG: ribonuclease III [Acidimicrobiales bacterium]|nr:MAG: ribonuclease III [Acidimicrobiales bacterium]
MSTASSVDAHVRAAARELNAVLGVTLDEPFLRLTLTHRSYAYEHGGLPTNERLEFLGDSVLGLVVTSTLYRNYPELPEGQLAKLRSSVVNMRALADVARRLGEHGLGVHVLLGKGEEATGGREKASILADTCEALLGAIYIQLGLEAASRVVHQLFDPVIEQAAQLGVGLDWKTSLQELAAAQGLGVPVYEISESGPDHAKRFEAILLVAGRRVGSGRGNSKKAAEQHAAQQAWQLLSAE